MAYNPSKLYTTEGYTKYRFQPTLKVKQQHNKKPDCDFTPEIYTTLTM
jgi:hypothetical protein